VIVKNAISKRKDRHLAIAAVAITLILSASAAVAAPDPSIESKGVSMALKDAMEFAVATDPTIRLAKEAVSLSLGELNQNSGPFDSTLGFIFSYDGDRTYIDGAGYRAEDQKRFIFRTIAENFQRTSDNLFEQLGGEGLVWADCARGTDIILPGGQPVCFTGREQARYELYVNLADASDLQEIAAGMVLANRHNAADLVDVLNVTAASLRQGLRNLGTVPVYRGNLSTVFDLRLTKLFRNGMILEPTLLLDGTQDNYIGKPQDPGFGGSGIPDNVRSILGVSLEIPLGKGRGKIATAAPETAARESYEAALADEAWAINLTVESTALSYWNLAAAQANLDLLRETEAIQTEILEMAEALVEADEYPEADLHFIRGRLELTRGRVAEAETSVLNARIGLARVIGQSLSTMDQAPMAIDDLPRVPEESVSDALAADALVTMALERRYDLAAARSRRDAAEILARGAAFDLKRRVDLELAVAVAGLHEGGDNSKFGDLVNGWWSAVSDFSAGPSFRLGLRFELPFGNHTARGLSLQAHSLQQQSRINQRDLERSVANEIERLTKSLEQAVQEGQRRLESVDQYREALASDIELYRAGEGSSIDVLLTQENLVTEEVLLISARRAIAFIVTQLVTETGRLVDCQIGDDEVTVMAFYPLDDVRALAAEIPAQAGGSGDGSR
jgi:outer membrane protein TolC